MTSPSVFAKNATTALHRMVDASPGRFDCEGAAAIVECAIRDATRDREAEARRELEATQAAADKRLKAAAHERLAHLLASSPAVIYSYEAKGDFRPTFVSDNIREWLGYEPQDYLQDAEFWRRLVHPDDLAAVEAEASQLFKKGRHTVEYRFLKKNGAYCWVNDEQSLIRDEDGQPAEVVGSWSDISERKRAEEAAAAAQARIEGLLSSSPAVIYSFKATGDYAPTFISRNIRDLLGYEREDYLNSADFWSSRVHPQDMQRIEKEYGRLFDEGRLSAEYRFRKKDGSYCWVSDELQLLRDAAGDPLEIVGSWNDISARKQIGEALVAAQDRIGRLLSSAPAVIYSYKASGDFRPTFVSENIRDWLGYEPQDYLQDADFWRRCVHPDDLASVEAEAVQLFKKGRHTVEYRFLKKDGSYCWVSDEQRLIRDEDGQPAEVVGSWCDIGERKRAELAATAAQARIELLLSSSPAVIYSFEAGSDYAPTFISRNVRDLLGYEREEYLHNADFWSSRVHPQDGPRIFKAYKRLFEEDRLSSEYRFRKKDGSYCWVSDELQVLRDSAGNPVEVVGAWGDITARKQLGEALVAAQDRLVHLLSCAPAVIYSFKASGDFAPTFVSQNIKDWLGYAPEEYLENPDFWWRCVHPDDRAGAESASTHLFRKGRNSFEYRFLKKDGTYCWVIDEQHLIRDHDGQPVEVVGSWSDITAPKEAEIAFRRSEQRLSDAIDSIPEGFALYDADDRLVICNRAYGQLLCPGRDAPERGTAYEILLRAAAEHGIIEDATGRVDAWVAEQLARHREPGEPHVQRRADGRWIHVAERKTTEGGTVVICTNISAIKRAEEEIREAKHRAELANALVSEKNRALELLSTKLSKYLSPQVYSSIFVGQRTVEIASSRKKLTVFFSDIADFTATTDGLESEELTGLLNRYLTEMSKIALKHGATIDKYIGDAILAFFGDPETRGVKEDALACVDMAVAMQRRMGELQTEWRDTGLEKPFELRIGINTGYCTVGNFGSEDRMDYTIVGSEVNLAARLQSHVEPGGILLSHATYSLVKDHVRAEERDLVHAKGFTKPVRNYKVLDRFDDMVEQGKAIREEREGLKVVVDLQKLDQAEAVKALESIVSRLKSDPR